MTEAFYPIKVLRFWSGGSLGELRINYNTNSLWLSKWGLQASEFWVDALSNYDMHSQSKEGVLATGGNEYWQHILFEATGNFGMNTNN